MRAASPQPNERRTHSHFVNDVLQNRNNRAIFDHWTELELPDGWLVAGCLFQTIWNLRSDAAPEASAGTRRGGRGCGWSWSRNTRGSTVGRLIDRDQWRYLQCGPTWGLLHDQEPP